MRWLLLGCFLPFLAVNTPGDEPRHKYFRITVVDDQTGRGVPLVELRTIHNIRYVTDSNGIVAFHEPGLMDQAVFFYVKSHGYEFSKDGFGFRGKALQVQAGAGAVLRIRRVNIAERLYRVTGAGIYRDSVLVGAKVPLRKPVLNGLVLGSDSVVNTIYQGKIHWFWGDTNKPSYPLGNFHVPGATSLLPGQGGLDPDVGVDLDYFLDDKGFARPTARLPGEGPTWINGLTTVKDAAGKERLFAAYAKIRGFLDVYERGLVEFDDHKKQFHKVVQFPKDAPLYPAGHPLLHAEGDAAYVYFANPFPLIRVRATVDDVKTLDSYEAFTCLKEGSRSAEATVERAADGTLRYGWRKRTAPVGPSEQAKLLKSGKIKPGEGLLQLQDVDSGKAVQAHGGSVYWNAFRQRWVLIAVESGGTSFLGEVWYAEGDTPLGPWVYARKIVSHDKYSFYNPKQHPFFDKDKGRFIYFEGTYTQLFSGNPDHTPHYDYNQIMYKLDLDDERLVLPVAVRDLGDSQKRSRFGRASLPPQTAGRVAFFAVDRPRKGAAPIYEHVDQAGVRALRVAAPGNTKSEPLFYALPVDAKDPPAPTMPLFEFVHQENGARVYVTDTQWSQPGFRRSPAPLCLVWRNPHH